VLRPEGATPAAAIGVEELQGERPVPVEAEVGGQCRAGPLERRQGVERPRLDALEAIIVEIEVDRAGLARIIKLARIVESNRRSQQGEQVRDLCAARTANVRVTAALVGLDCC
jgi:hypothetical protein